MTSRNKLKVSFYSIRILYSKLEIKDTTESSMSASYVDIFLSRDINGKLTAQLHDKREDFNFSIAQWAIAFASQAKGWVFESQPRQWKKQVVTAPLLNAQQSVTGPWR